MEKNRDFFAVFGRSGSGKTHLIVNTVIPGLQKKQKPIVIFDLMQEYPEQLRKAKIKNVNVFSSFSDFREKILKSKKISGVNVIAWKSDQDIVHGIKAFFYLKIPVCLIFEEIHTLYNSELQRRIDVELKGLTFYGRHYNIDICMIAQRPKSLNTNTRSQLDFAISFHQHLEADIQALSTIDKKSAEKVMDLQESREFVILNEGPSWLEPELKYLKK